MKRVFLKAVLLLLAVTSLSAQTATPSLVGAWQGTLPIAATGQGSNGGNGIRIVITIRKDPDNSLHAVMTPIDLGNATPLTSVSVSAPNVTFALGDTVVFRGKLSADGRSIAGIWGQAPQSLSLTLNLATEDTLWHRAGPSIPPMAANADPSFEVATIKPTPLEEDRTLFDLHARKFTAQHTSAAELIKIAYNIRGRQVLNAPGLDNTKYDIVAEPDTPGMPSENQVRAMVRKLLVERFHLVCHTSTQDYPVMALTLDPKGPAPKPADPSVNPNGGLSGHRDGDDIVYEYSGSIHDLLAWMMNTFQDKQLVDETGLTGNYDVTLRVAGMAQPSGPVTSDDFGNALVLAAQHAGFRFVSRKEPLPVVIVDHIDLPTPN